MICVGCKQDKPADQFSRDNSTKAPRTKCKRCRADEQRERRQQASPHPMRRYKPRDAYDYDPECWWQQLRPWPWPPGTNVFGE